MKIETKIQAAIEQLKQQVAVQKAVEQQKAEQKQKAIAQKKAEILEFLKLAGVDESAVKWHDQDFNPSERLCLTVTLLGFPVSIKSDSGLYELNGQWDWLHPKNNYYTVGDKLCLNEFEVEQTLIKSVSESVFEFEMEIDSQSGSAEIV